jgi:hypothetical protein
LIKASAAPGPDWLRGEEEDEPEEARAFLGAALGLVAVLRVALGFALVFAAGLFAM